MRVAECLLQRKGRKDERFFVWTAASATATAYAVFDDYGSWTRRPLYCLPNDERLRTLGLRRMYIVADLANRDAAWTSCSSAGSTRITSTRRPIVNLGQGRVFSWPVLGLDAMQRRHHVVTCREKCEIRTEQTDCGDVSRWLFEAKQFGRGISSRSMNARLLSNVNDWRICVEKKSPWICAMPRLTFRVDFFYTAFFSCVMAQYCIGHIRQLSHHISLCEPWSRPNKSQSRHSFGCTKCVTT